MIRAASALLLLLSLLAGIVTIPAAPVLVCDRTGLPMTAPATAMTAKPKPGIRPCCASKSITSAASPAATCAVKHTSCCRLRQARTPEQPPVLRHGDAPLFAVLTTPLPLPTAVTVALRASRPSPRRAAPRAPPGSHLPARAPPSLA